jgi:hypothetical protein
MTHSFVAEKETFWIAHDTDVLEYGILEAGEQISTGLAYLETYDDPATWSSRQVALQRNYEKALAQWLEYQRLNDPLALLADHRWRVETGGITLPTGIFVRTDRETQSRLVESFASVQSGLLTAPIQWKLTSGEWITLSLEELGFIIAAVSNHVRNCFEAERLVEKQYREGTVTDVVAAFDAELASLK